jgi:Raf kinase inhibitor-like YbhB/YbcL family protein
VKLETACFADQQPIPGECAFCIPDANSHATLGPNRNPDFTWSDLPAGTRSLAMICHDRDVPSKADDVNKESRTIPAALPRIDFFHWILVDLDPAGGPIRKGEFSDGVTARGKPGPQSARGARQGINDFSAWFGADKDMGGDYFGYDGPCPPWNDSIVHHYVFTLYALDVARLALQGNFKGPDVLGAMRRHVLGQASVTGLYSLNPAVPV